MTKLFETSWRSGYEFFERYHDSTLQRSVTNQIRLPYEWYEPSSNGLYTSVLDDSIRLDKKQGRAKEGRDNYGFLDPIYRNIRDNYWDKDSGDGYNKNPRIFYLDIETRVGQNSTGFPVPEKALEQVSLIQVYDSRLEMMFILGLREWKHEKEFIEKNEITYPIRYFQCRDEYHLFEAYFALFQKLDPLIIYAWNGDGFDYPYLYNRLKNLGLDPNLLSNHGSVSMEEKEFKGRTEFKMKFDGHFYLDLMKVYKVFNFKPRASFSLDNIAEVELGERKVQHPEYAAFDDFYTGKYIIPDKPTEAQKDSRIYQEAIAGNWDEVKELAHSEFVFYGATDTFLIKRLDDKLNLTNLMIMIAEKMGVQIGDSLGTVKPWSQYIANRSMESKKVMPPKKENGLPKVVGGYVRDPEVGKHKWVLSADVNSMYPLLGMTGFNMSPEKFVPKHRLPPELRDIILSYYSSQDEEKTFKIPSDVKEKTKELLQEHELSLGINGAVFSNDSTGMIPEMIVEIYTSRKKAKKTMFEYEKKAIQIKEILKKRGA